jgi:23S rRNA (guanosine2251-2'-O)-methyltransferase
VSNVADTIRKLKKANVWVAGAALSPESTEYTKADFDRDLAIVIGAEGEGLSQLVARECDYIVRIPLLGETESLNASVAAAILLYEAVRQRGSEASRRPTGL